MTEQLTVLLTSVGRRVELVRLLDRAIAAEDLPVRLISTDIDPLAPAAHFMDERARMVPKFRDPGFVPAIADICTAEHVDLVLPLIDPDIERLATDDGRVAGTGAVFGSVRREFVDAVSDKLETFRFMTAHGIPTPLTWTPDEFEFDGTPVIIKPRNGSGGANVFVVHNRAELEFFTGYVPDPILQEMLPGPEVTVDVIIGRDRQLLGTAQRERIAVRGGEVSKGVTVADPEIAALALTVAGVLDAEGPITVQGMWADDGFRVTEVNARMGGGLPLACAAGLDVPGLLFGSWLGRPAPTEPLQAEPGVFLTRFDDSFFFRS